jgi:hypothetical protein
MRQLVAADRENIVVNANESVTSPAPTQFNAAVGTSCFGGLGCTAPGPTWMALENCYVAGHETKVEGR